MGMELSYSRYVCLRLERHNRRFDIDFSWTLSGRDILQLRSITLGGLFLILTVVGSEKRYWTKPQTSIAKKFLDEFVYRAKHGLLILPPFEHPRDEDIDYHNFSFIEDFEGCSGECPKGGVDIWFRQACEKHQVPFHPMPPEVNSWNDRAGKRGYKSRNTAMARFGDVCIDIEPQWKPIFGANRKAYLSTIAHGTGFYRRSGGTWTANIALKMKKPTYTVIIPEVWHESN